MPPQGSQAYGSSEPRRPGVDDIPADEPNLTDIVDMNGNIPARPSGNSLQEYCMSFDSFERFGKKPGEKPQVSPFDRRSLIRQTIALSDAPPDSSRATRSSASSLPNRKTDKRKEKRNSLSAQNVLKEDDVPLRGSLLGIMDRVQALQDKEVPRKGLRKFASLLVTSHTFQFLMAVIIIVHICIGVHETNLRAEETAAPIWLTTCEAAILAAYLSEITVRVFVKRVAFFCEPWNFFDVTIVLCDALLLVIPQFVSSSSSTFGHFSLLRSIRLLRVFRVLKKFLIFREVYFMVSAVFSALRTLIFGGLIGFAILTSWSLLAVEILNPLVKQLAEQGVFDDCERCHRAFSSVMASNLTFLKTIVAGDSWGQISVPLMESFPEAAVLLTLVLLTIQMGVVNIIIAVIVDRVSAARVNDVTLCKTMKEEALRRSYKQLRKVFKSMDDDGNGNLSVAEMWVAYRENADFRFIVQSMDFTSDNMDIFFDILDKDHSGEVSYEEFVEQLHMMREFDSHTMLVQIRHLVESLSEHIGNRFDEIMVREGVVESLSEHIGNRFDEIMVREEDSISKLMAGRSEGNKSVKLRDSFSSVDGSSEPSKGPDDSVKLDGPLHEEKREDIENIQCKTFEQALTHIDTWGDMRTAALQGQLCETALANTEHSRLKLLKQTLVNIDVLEAHMRRLANIVETFVEDLHVYPSCSSEGPNPGIRLDACAAMGRKPLLASLEPHLFGPPTTAALKDEESKSNKVLFEEVLRRTSKGLSEGSELKQIKNAVQLCLSHIISQVDVAEHPFLKDIVEPIRPVGPPVTKGTMPSMTVGFVPGGEPSPMAIDVEPMREAPR